MNALMIPVAQPVRRRWRWWLVAALTAGLPACARSEPQPIRLAVSLDTRPTHIRNQTVARFAGTVSRRSGGRLRVVLYESGQLYRGRDVATAVAQGAIEMGVPGLWQLGTIVPEASVTMLPMFHGARPAAIHDIMDGELGREIDAALERRLGVTVVGRYLDLGYSAIFSATHQVAAASDLAGLRIRVAGGAADVLRLAALGAAPVALPFSDVPLALAQGGIDGLQTSHETVRSARLWEAGVRYAYDDRQTFYQYVPLINRAFWDRQRTDLQEIVRDAWAQAVEEGRAEAMAQQARARAELVRHGVEVVEASDAETLQVRRRLRAAENGMITRLGLDPDYVARVRARLEWHGTGSPAARATGGASSPSATGGRR